MDHKVLRVPRDYLGRREPRVRLDLQDPEGEMVATGTATTTTSMVQYFSINELINFFINNECGFENKPHLKKKLLHIKIGVIKMVQLAKSSSSALSAPTNVAASLCS